MATTKPKRTTKAADARPRDASSVPETPTREPHEINAALSSDRMQALLADHRKMGARPATEPAGDAHAASYPLKDK